MVMLRSWIRRLHLPAMAGSFILAVLLWLYVQLQQDYVYRMQIPIVLTNIKEGKILKQPVPPIMIIQMNGPGTALIALRLLLHSQVKFYLNLETINEYWKCPTNNYINWVSLPRGLEHLRVQRVIYPDTVIVMLDAIGQSRIPVKGDSIKITARSGYTQIGAVVFKPDSVSLSGPASLLKDIKNITTVSRVFADRDHDFSVTVPLSFPSSSIRYSSEEVNAAAVIQRIGERTFKNIPVTVTNVPKGIHVRVNPENATITVNGGERFVQSIGEQDITAYIPYQQQWRRKRNYQIPVQITCPKNVLYFNVFPSVFTIMIE